MNKYDVIVVGGGFAGTAATLAIDEKKNVRDIDVEKLRGVLREEGFVI